MLSERRCRRSQVPADALKLLMDSLFERSDVRAVAVVDDNGQILAGTGESEDLDRLARITPKTVKGEPCSDFEVATQGTDFFARGIALCDRTLYLSALGFRVRRMYEAAKGVARILAKERATI